MTNIFNKEIFNTLINFDIILSTTLAMIKQIIIILYNASFSQSCNIMNTITVNILIFLQINSMSDEINHSQGQIQNYLPVMGENSFSKANLKKRKVGENDTQKKKFQTKTNSVSDESDEQQPQNMPQQQLPSTVRSNKLEMYFKAAPVKSSLVKKAAIATSKVAVNESEEAPKFNQKLQQLEASERLLRQEKAQLEQERNMHRDRLETFKRRTLEIFVETLKENERLKRDQCWEYLERERHRLGGKVIRRDNMRFADELLDGVQIQQLKAQLKRIEGELVDLKKQKAEMKMKSQGIQRKNNEKQTKLSFGEDNSNSQADLDIQQKKNRISFQLVTLEKEETDLRLQLQRLEEERLRLVQRLGKFEEEAGCRYNRSDPPWPCLGGRYQMLGLLGKGGFSEVYRSFDLEEFRYCACKIHTLNQNWSESSKNNYLKHVMRENAIHQRLKHQNIVQVYAIQEIDQESFCTVMEYCDGSDLSQYLKKYKALAEKEAKNIVRQVLAALHYMNHQQPKIIHYDLKPSNILFHKGEVKISDFGLCKILDQDQTRLDLTSQGVGTYWYLPPECFQVGDTTISTKVDVWSLGVIFYEMVFGRKPFGEGQSQERLVKDQVILKAYQPTFPAKSGVSKECQEFIAKCLTYNMEARWDVSEAYYAPYLNK